MRRTSWPHNLGTVLAFEVRRTLRRRSFWLMTLAVPAFMLAMMTLVTFSNSTAVTTSDASRSQPVAFTYMDASGLVDPAVASAAGGHVAADAAAARDAVVQGTADLFVAYPADPAKQPIEIVGRDRGLLDGGGSYASTARSVLMDSAKLKVPDPRVSAVLIDRPSTHVLTYTNGHVAPGWASVILPGAFIVLFYMAILLLGNQMLNITVEEKENRVTEMILTTIHPTTLIVGKIVALLVLGIVQSMVAVLPLALAPALLARTTSMSASDRAELNQMMPTPADILAAVNPGAIAVAAALFVGAFLMFTGLLVSIGAVMPTAKDAGQAFGVIVICLFLPFYTMGLIASDPHGAVSQAMTFFPLTAPITAMVRNATGTLTTVETVAVLAVIYLAAAAFLALGIRLFRAGSISYDARLDVRKVLGIGRPHAHEITSPSR